MLLLSTWFLQHMKSHVFGGILCNTTDPLTALGLNYPGVNDVRMDDYYFMQFRAQTNTVSLEIYQIQIT